MDVVHPKEEESKFTGLIKENEHCHVIEVLFADNADAKI